MKLKDSEMCAFCETVDTIEHRFIDCDHVATFWQDLITWWNKHVITRNPLNLSPK
jgi:hypothetical protein